MSLLSTIISTNSHDLYSFIIVFVGQFVLIWNIHAILLNLVIYVDVECF